MGHEFRSQPEAADILDALANLVKSDRLLRSPTQSKLLRYVVEQSLAGRTGQIKAYTIAVDALERAPTFDALTDPIVRVEAMRLRKVLKTYYEAEGRNDKVRITLPKGRYVPHFAWAVAIPAPVWQSEVAEASPRLAPIAGMPESAPSVQFIFTDIASLAGAPAKLARGLERALVDAVPCFGFIRWATRSSEAAVNIVAASIEADFTLRCSFAAAGEHCSLSVCYQLWANATQNVIAQSEIVVQSRSAIQRDVEVVCSALFGHSGCIHRHNLTEMLSGRRFGARYECKLHYLNVVHSYGDLVREAEARMAIEAQLQHDYGFALGYAFLAHLIFRQSLRHPPGLTQDNLMLRAWHLALRGTELAPNSGFAYATLYWLSDLRGEASIAERALQTALRLNPHDVEIKMAHGARLICYGELAQGVHLIQSGLSADLSQPVQYFFYLALGEYLLGDIEGSERHGLLIPADANTVTQSHPGALLLRALIAQAKGHADLAQKSALAMEQTLLPTGNDAIGFLRRVIKHQPSLELIKTAYNRALSNNSLPASALTQ